jgi:hypothetical protein
MPHSVTQTGFAGSPGTANAILNFLLNTAADTCYIALFLVAPTASGGGTEVSGTGYARVSFTRNTTSWPAASAGSIANGIVFDFGTAGSDWAAVGVAQIVGAAIVKTSSGALGSSDIIIYCEITPRNVLSGDPVKVPVGALTASAV